MKEIEFYSYMWLREDGTPYYVGKGCGRRAHKSYGHSVKMPKDKCRILIFPQLSEADALESEIELIKLFGRKDNGTGCLRNLTDGGEGISNPSAEVRAKMAANGKIQGRRMSESGRTQAMIRTQMENKTGIFSPDNDRRPLGHVTGTRMKKEGRGIFAIPHEQHIKNSQKAGVTNSKSGHIQKLGRSQGIKNIESGHLAKLRTAEHQAVAARSARHKQWHVARGIFNPKCSLCLSAKVA